MIACGPFTSTENLLFEPLHDLLNEVRKNPPHVLILIGPILDSSHPHVSGNTLTETYINLENTCVSNITSALKE